MTSKLRFFAVVDGSHGFVLGYYPEEKRRYKRECGKTIIGDFAAPEEAQTAVMRVLSNRAQTADTHRFYDGTPDDPIRKRVRGNRDAS